MPSETFQKDRILINDFTPDEQVRVLLARLTPECWPIACESLPRGTALVGGAIRDALLGRQSNHTDLDFVVPADALRHTQHLARTFGGTCVVLDGDRDTARLILKGWTIDLASQEGMSLEEDLWRRDYSLNAIALGIQPFGSLCDPTGGIHDLQKRRLRAICESNLVDDPLRLLRGLRLLAEISLVLDTDTALWIQRHRQALAKSAPERILSELQLLVKGAYADQVLQQLDQFQLLEPWAATTPNPTQNQAECLSDGETATALPLARLTGLISDDGLKRLRASKMLRHRCARLRYWVERTAGQPDSLGEEERLRLHQDLEKDLAALILWLPPQMQPQWLKRWRDTNDPLFHPIMPLNGVTLKRELGLEPGPKMGQVLAHLCLERAFGRIHSRDEALQTARQFLRQN
ncbi:CCA tRNA nucleotidyltransferase [Synechococcus sp. M16CYN]|uniref:CCA tRNA nucleotidyltransferase n=1 Tax=Synechococcus sp. M16CYN TaxID=3103139 RepID=UPI0032568672